jgi:hypothetical protein
VLEMVGKELRDINFSLNGSSRLNETNGECVWEGSVNEERYAGIRFKNIKQNHNTPNNFGDIYLPSSYGTTVFTNYQTGTEYDPVTEPATVALPLALGGLT